MRGFAYWSMILFKRSLFFLFMMIISLLFSLFFGMKAIKEGKEYLLLSEKELFSVKESKIVEIKGKFYVEGTLGNQDLNLNATLAGPFRNRYIAEKEKLKEVYPLWYSKSCPSRGCLIKHLPWKKGLLALTGLLLVLYFFKLSARVTT